VIGGSLQVSADRRYLVDDTGVDDDICTTAKLNIGRLSTTDQGSHAVRKATCSVLCTFQELIMSRKWPK